MNNLYQRLRLSGYIMINTVFTLISIAEPIWSWNGYSSSWCLSPNECLDFEENGSLSELTLHSLPMLSQSTEPYTGKKKKKKQTSVSRSFIVSTCNKYEGALKSYRPDQEGYSKENMYCHFDRIEHFQYPPRQPLFTYLCSSRINYNLIFRHL